MGWIKKIFGGSKKSEMIRFLEWTYKDLKSKNPDKDEHWFLINTFLARYGNWEASRRKGPALMKFIAFKDTFQYSILDTPKSIRGLVLYLVYKELGEKEAQDDVVEYSQIMELSQDLQKEEGLINIYKRKNPFTWNEVSSEKDEYRLSRYGFLESADHLSKNPEELERKIKEVESLGS